MMTHQKAFKVPAPGKPSAPFYRGKLGEQLNVKRPGFDLSDPNMKVTCGAYNSLHDPLLKTFFSQPERKKQLLKQGLISDDDKVLCSRKEYRQYTEYISTVQLSWKKHFHQQKKQLPKDFMLQKMEGRSPQTVGHTNMTALLLSRSRRTLRSKKIMEPGSQRYAELVWEVAQRLLRKRLEKEVIQPPLLVPVEIVNLEDVISSVSPDSEVINDLVSIVLRKIQDSPSSETSFDSHPASPVSISVSSGSKGQMFSPDSEVAMDLVSRVLRKIQDSPSGLSLPDTSSEESSELQSFYGMDEMLESSKPPVAVCVEGRCSSSTSYESSSDVTLIDLETSFDSRPTAHSVSPMSSDLDAQAISPTSEAAMDFVSGILREIEDSPSMTESPCGEYSELQSASEKDRKPNHPFANMEEWRSSPACSVNLNIPLIDLEMYDYSHPLSSTSLSVSSDSRAQTISPTSEAAMDLVSDVLRRIENSSASDHSLSDHSSLEETAGGQSNNPTGTKKPSLRKQGHAFFSRSWTSVRQIFAFARRSNKIHPL